MQTKPLKVRALLIIMAICLAFYSYRLHRLYKNNAAIARLRTAGIPVFVPYPDGSSALVSSFAAYPSTSVAQVNLSDPALTKQNIRKLIPDLQVLIPANFSGQTRSVNIFIQGNPNFTPKMIKEMRKQLPHCNFKTF